VWRGGVSTRKKSKTKKAGIMSSKTRVTKTKLRLGTKLDDGGLPNSKGKHFFPGMPDPLKTRDPDQVGGCRSSSATKVGGNKR